MDSFACGRWRVFQSLTVVLLAVWLSPARGAELTWIGGTDNSWHTPANWAPIEEGDPPQLVQRVPRDGDKVNVASDSAQPILLHGDTADLGSLTLGGGELDTNEYTLKVNRWATVNGGAVLSIRTRRGPVAGDSLALSTNTLLIGDGARVKLSDALVEIRNGVSISGSGSMNGSGEMRLGPEMAGTLIPAAIAGDSIQVSGDSRINASPDAVEIDGSLHLRGATFEASVPVMLYCFDPEQDCGVAFAPSTRFVLNDGSGLYLSGFNDATFASIQSGEIDMDGETGDTLITVGLWSSLYIKSPALDNDLSSPAFDGTIHLDGSDLTLDIEGGWELDGRLELGTNSHRGSAQVYGMPITVDGDEPGDGIFVGSRDIDNTEIVTIHTDIVFTENAAIHFGEYEAVLRITGDVTSYRGELGIASQDAWRPGFVFSGDSTTFAVPTRLNVGAGFWRGNVELAGDLTVGTTIGFYGDARFVGPGRILVEDQATAYLLDGSSVDVPIVNQGTLEVGGAGSSGIRVHSLEQASTSQMRFIVGIAGDRPARLDVSQAVILNGGVEIESYRSFESFRSGMSFQLISAQTSVHGRFASYTLPDLREGLFWRIDYEPNSVGLSIVDLLEGDFNGDDHIDQADLDLVLLNWGEDAAVPPEGWTNDPPSGVIDQAELDRVLLGWGDLAVRPAASAVARVPEPSAWLLGAAGALAFFHYQGRRCRRCRGMRWTPTNDRPAAADSPTSAT